MVEIIINDNQTCIETEDLQIFIDGSFEIKKEGANAPTINIGMNFNSEDNTTLLKNIHQSKIQLSGQ